MQIELDELYGLDIYLLDHILRGHVPEGSSVLDAGCGGGRNLAFFHRHGYDVHGIDRDEASIATLRAGAEKAGLADADARFRVADVADLPVEDGRFDVVLCNAVLHFARDEDHFAAMVRELAATTAPHLPPPAG